MLVKLNVERKVLKITKKNPKKIKEKKYFFTLTKWKKKKFGRIKLPI